MSTGTDWQSRQADERRSTKNAATADWTPERIEELTKLWTEGHSCSQIANMMGGGATRNSVIGKANRLKLPARLSRSPYANVSKRLSSIPRGRRKRTTVKAISVPRLLTSPWQVHAPPEPVVPFVEPVLVAPDDRFLSLIQLTDKTCRWPIGDPKVEGFHFCGSDPRDGSRYCEFHYRRSTSRASS